MSSITSLNKLVFKTLVLTIALFTNCISIKATKEYKFQQISVDEGLKNSRVVSVIQDKEGYMWFATHNGLDKFNGNDIQHYSMSSPEGFFANDDIINCLILSDHFDILCGTKNGNLYAYDREADLFHKILPFKQDDALFNIYALLSENDKELWIGTTGGLFYFNLSTQQLVQIKDIKSGVNTIERCDANSIWVGSINGLYRINKQTLAINDIVHPFDTTKPLGEKDIMAIYPIDTSRLLVGTRDSELYLVERQNDQLTLLRHTFMGLKDKNIPITDIVSTPEKNYAIALDGIGIMIVDTALQVVKTYISNDNDASSLSSNGVYKLYYSKDNILWAATYGGGVNFADPNKKQFQIAQHQPHITNSLRNNTVNSILEKDNQQTWIGTKTGISIYSADKNKWRHIPSLFNPKHKPFHVMAMCKGEKDHIWVATYGRGLFKLNARDFTKKRFYKNGKGIHQTETNHLYQVIMDQQKRIWTGGIWGGITVIDESKNIRQRVNVSNVRSLFEYNQSIYVGTLFGLFIVDQQTLEVSRPKHNSLISSRIICIAKHPTLNKLCLGTDAKGLIEWNQDNDSIKILTTEEGLPSNYIRSITWDNQNKMWISSTGGLSSYNDASNVFDNYNKSDGLANTEFSENAVFLHSSGQLIYGGPKGISFFYPDEITKSTQITTPILNNIKLFGKKLEINPEGPLTRNINLQNGIRLAHDQNSLSFSFGAISYTNPQKIKFKWKLEGFENHWNGPTSVREAIYSKLPPGDFVFKVMVSNDDGIWQKEIKEFSIKIDKPFWKTYWAFFLYALILLCLLFLTLHYYHIIIQEKHATEKQQFFISIAHDLRTPLSLIKLPIEKMAETMSNDEKENRNLVLVKRNVDRLTNLVNQLLDFQKADLKKMQLQADEHPLGAFITERVESFTPLAEEKNIDVSIIQPDSEIPLWFDKSKMEKIMYNLLSNAFKYTPKGGAIKVTIEITQKYAVISVSDTGEGIPAHQQKNIFQRYYRATNAINSQEVGSGVGLMLTKQLTELHKGKISFTSEYGKGSTFIIKLRLGNQHFSEEEMRHPSDAVQQRTPIVQSRSEEIPPETNGPKLLLVEDNPELLETLCLELSNDYQVYKAADGAEGVEKAMEIMPDIIVSDVMMPKMNGHQLCLKLKSELVTCHIPIILLTALDSPEYKREGIEHGADAYLEKPFDIKLLRAQIKNLLKNRQLLKKKFLLPSSNVKEASPTNADEEFLEKIRTYIINNIDNPELSVEATASEIGISRPVLYRKIKSLTDLSPQKFLMTIKLKEAARIMKEEKRNISETAYMIGFSDPKYFSQIFKKHFGMTPSQYLKQK
ncbi:hybrid sensor histidine kinase/response regulator [Marinilabiliaceae bacterium JC017]|nr:hybrid sensor histidine kinase/response regulator [Marinilabiliaceae bacterium JC017]